MRKLHLEILYSALKTVIFMINQKRCLPFLLFGSFALNILLCVFVCFANSKLTLSCEVSCSAQRTCLCLASDSKYPQTNVVQTY